jgi:hypothetical protein
MLEVMKLAPTMPRLASAPPMFMTPFVPVPGERSKTIVVLLVKVTAWYQPVVRPVPLK